MKIGHALSLASSLLMTAGTAALAQDPVELSPRMYSVLLENEHVRVLDFRAEPGEKEPMHSHPAHVVYVLADGKVRLTTKGGEAEEIESKAGTAVWADALTHSYENLAPTKAHVLIVEMKGMEAARQADLRAIEKVRERELAALLGGDADGMVAVFTEDCVVMPPNEPAIEGHPALRKWFDSLHRHSTLTGGYGESDVSVAGDWAIEHFTARLAVTPKAGGEAVDQENKGIHIYRRQPDGTWRIAHDIWNSDTPAPDAE
ncbi:MAG TPA: nuclear transport factor 2 family protein [Thermoanaerobaculia bacterium]|nr:nuclear transport factor 2 family protein [Thermoanaerobaculia bacterium]